MATQLLAPNRSLTIAKRSFKTYRSAAFQPVRNLATRIRRAQTFVRAADKEAEEAENVQVETEDVEEAEVVEEVEEEVTVEDLELLPTDLESLPAEEQIAVILSKLEAIEQAEGSGEDIVIDLADGEDEDEEEVDGWDADSIESAVAEAERIAAEDIVLDEALAESDEEKQDVAERKELMLKRIEEKIESEQFVSLAETELLLASKGLTLDDVPTIEMLDGTKPVYGRDFELETIVTSEEKQALEPFKLSKGELRGLIPEDWDSVDIEWLGNKKADRVNLPEYKLNILWLDKNIAVSVDQVYSRGQTSPLTEYFFWPRKDAWEELKVALEALPWVPERDRVVLLNRVTEVINYWQDEESKHGVEDARQYFPDCTFTGA